MTNLFEGLQHISVVVAAVLATYFPTISGNIPTQQNFEKEAQKSFIVRTGQYTYSGQTLKYTIHIPKQGGEVNGQFSGVCNGPIRGQFDSGPAQTVTGRASATCLILLNKKLTANYIAHLDLEDGKAYIDWTGEIPYTSGKGSFTIDFEPIHQFVIQ